MAEAAFRRDRGVPEVSRGATLRVGSWLVSAVLLLGFWNWSVAAWRVSPAIFPPPGAVWQSLWENLHDGTYAGDLGVTLREVLVGFAMGSTAGFVLALLIAEFVAVRVVVYPYVIGTQAIPKSALAPMFLIWFGFGMASKVALVVSITFFPVLVNTLSGLERTDPDQLDLLRAYCGRRWRVFLRVKLPSALPQLFAGLELAIVLAVIAAVVAELLGATGGIGYRVLVFNMNLDMAGEFSALIVLSLAGYALHFAVRWLGRRLVFWGNIRDDQLGL